MTNQSMSAAQVLKQANQLKREGKLDEAINFYWQAIKLNPGFSFSYYEMGDAQEKNGDFSEALIWYEKAIDINPKIDYFHLKLKNIHLKLKKINLTQPTKNKQLISRANKCKSTPIKSPNDRNKIGDIVDFGIWYCNSINSDLESRLAELTAYHTRHALHVDYTQFIHSRDINYILEFATKDYVFVQCPGHTLKFKNVPGIQSSFISELEGDNFIIKGHILDHNFMKGGHGKYYGIHHQSFLVDIKKWNQIGRPIFGTANPSNTELKKVFCATRSPDNIHDDYTPVYLQSRGEDYFSTVVGGYGWNLISEGLRHGYKVINFTQKFRDFKFYGYPEYLKADDASHLSQAMYDLREPERFHLARNSSNSRVRVIANFFRPEIKTFSQWVNPNNTEGVLDKLHEYPRTKGKIRQGLFVSQGFHANILLDYYGMTEETELVIYDISEDQLLFKKYVNDNWNGTNLKDFVLKHRNKLCHETAEIMGINSINKTFENRVIRHFGSEEKWLNHWSIFKSIKKEYILGDITKNHNFLTSKIKPDGHVAITIANIFNYWPYVVMVSAQERLRAYQSFVNSCVNYNSLTSVIGEKAIDYSSGRRYNM
ncbi:MAG: tetratricopeptide repeat protein [Limnospira sp. PMC 1240.20]|uniref:tetratricopeptide repeat protein n=1 Tax=unclassified Limnospira TaxID=2642885 RepID=UPI0028E10A16|nr:MULTISPECIES: tetratricopeptide repeat protein [unclassified Limnospira]MDT9194712.1 tetratricopeptide repeat protein [Limnospira sp. PMC 1245.20]MDT9205511.1 tetratricopeptide repeat protein [Limnospira sp. PMC 1243.20]MDT9210085.1 tetratricopeptide repeat protein [Limnospira sp. PMC 1252.20]MDT9215245.1 tetratricopeptide repeat protein [Limnospira sp. PMC 1256.20]MDT9220500.1 tetratricopeptide repeat protein [Limnospira sp. PMC 1240.20]